MKSSRRSRTKIPQLSKKKKRYIAPGRRVLRFPQVKGKRLAEVEFSTYSGNPPSLCASRTKPSFGLALNPVSPCSPIMWTGRPEIIARSGSGGLFAARFSGSDAGKPVPHFGTSVSMQPTPRDSGVWVGAGRGRARGVPMSGTVSEGWRFSGSGVFGVLR